MSRRVLRSTMLSAAAATLLGATASLAAPLHDVQLPASNLSVAKYVPLSQLAGHTAAIAAVDPNAIYSNVTNFLGQAVSQGPAAGGITRLFMDDVRFTTNPGVSNVTTIRFSVYNGNATSQSVRARIRFWNADGAALGGGLPNGPGTYYAPGGAGTEVGFSFNPFTFAPGVTTLTGNLGAGFAVPAGTTTTLWAGITYDNVGTTTGATNTELSNFGQGFFNPVDLGSSTDTIFETTAAGSFFTVSNPAGAAANFGGSPVANFGWEFVVTTLPVELIDVTVN